MFRKNQFHNCVTVYIGSNHDAPPMVCHSSEMKRFAWSLLQIINKCSTDNVFIGAVSMTPISTDLICSLAYTYACCFSVTISPTKMEYYPSTRQTKWTTKGNNAFLQKLYITSHTVRSNISYKIRTKELICKNIIYFLLSLFISFLSTIKSFINEFFTLNFQMKNFIL